MRFKRLAWLCTGLTAAMALTACNLSTTPAPTVDVNAIYTEAAQTALAGFSAQLTQTAQAIPPTAMPTNTALATFTMLPTFPPAAGVTPLGPGTLVAGTPMVISSPVPTMAGPQCNDSAFMGENYPDGTEMKPGTDFVKLWEIKNTGTCKWDDGYTFVFIAGDKMDGYDIPLKNSGDFVDPGETTQMEVAMTAHLDPGTYSGCWRMQDDHGYYFGTLACYEIVVVK